MSPAVSGLKVDDGSAAENERIWNRGRPSGVEDNLDVGLHRPPLGQLSQISNLDILLEVGDGRIRSVEVVFIFGESLQPGPDVPVSRGHAE